VGTIALELGQPTMRWIATCFQGAVRLSCGDLVAGEQLAQRGFRIGREAGEPDSFVAYGTALAFIRRYQGRAAEIVDAVKQNFDAYPRLLSWRAGLPWILCAADRHAEARALLDAVTLDHLKDAPDGLTAHAFYADVAIETGSSSAASSLYRLMEPYSDQFVANGFCGYGHVRMWLGLLAGLLGEHEQADHHLTFACEVHDTNGLLLWLARTHLGWAEALAARGDAAVARDHAARALKLSREHGYGLFEPRAAALVETESAAGT